MNVNSHDKVEKEIMESTTLSNNLTSVCDKISSRYYHHDNVIIGLFLSQSLIGVLVNIALIGSLLPSGVQIDPTVKVTLTINSVYKVLYSAFINPLMMPVFTDLQYPQAFTSLSKHLYGHSNDEHVNDCL